MKAYHLAIAVAALVGPAHFASATVLDDFNNALWLVDFRFDDVAGTQLPSTLNSLDPLATFDVDTDNDLVVTNGSGMLDASGKNNTDFGSNYVDLPTLSTGHVISLFEGSYSFDENVYDPAEDEEFRLTMITFDPRSTFVTAETFFTRVSATEVELYGNGVGTGSSDTPVLTLGSSGRFLTLLDADLDAHTFALFYSSDNGSTFTQVGAGALDPTRGVESLRLVINEDYSNDSLLIDRIALATYPFPEPTAATMAWLGCLIVAPHRRRK
ncbi:MAG: hypothetical protein KDA61_07110 [Planctomycetales bacterium]|nr:hypothetical protein [Planctomycetales bacterium]